MTRWSGDWVLPLYTKEKQMASSSKIAQKGKRAAVKKSTKEQSGSRSSTARPYPAWTFESSLVLARAIQDHASGERVARLTLLGKLDKSPNSSQTQNMITNSAKYGLTKGS